MKDIKVIVAKNIGKLRQSHGMTQLELAERLNYSDKAVSKWERGESLPDVAVLTEIADLFSVPLDYLVREEHEKEKTKPEKTAGAAYNRKVIAGVSVLLVWFLALLAFVVLSLFLDKALYAALSFVYAIPVSLIVWLVLNSIWFNPRRNYLIISLLMWSVLFMIHVTVIVFLPAGKIGLIYLLGIPGQLMILLWSQIKRKSNMNE